MSSSGVLHHELREVCPNISSKILIILIPGVGTALPSTWFGLRGQSLPEMFSNGNIPSPVLYQFDHGLNLELESRLWDNILDKGKALLEELMGLLNNKVKAEHLRRCAIIFIAHSLGGIIAKQCLYEAFCRNVPEFKYIVRGTAAFIAIASPHSKSEEPKEWNQPQLLFGNRNPFKKGYLTSPQDAIRLATLCKRFEGLMNDFQIVTLCETKATTIKRLRVTTAKTLIIPANACRIDSHLEEFIAVDANHFDICNVKASEHLQRCISQAVDKALSRLDREIQDDPPIHSLDKATIASHNTTDGMWNENESDTGKYATAGSRDTRSRESLPLTDFSTAKRNPCLPCYIIPSARNRDFQGRKEVIERIEKCFFPIEQQESHEGIPKSFGLCGPGGMGKTQVVNEYVHTHMDLYEAIFWLDAEEPITLAHEFSQIAEKLGLVLEGTSDATNQVITRDLVKGWLAQPVRSYNRTDRTDDEVAWLLIFDNVNDVDTISDYWPTSGTVGSILVTSRNHQAKTPHYRMMDGMDLPQLSKEDGGELLLKLTWRENDPEEQKLAPVVTEMIGGYPLALTHLAGKINRQSLSFADILARYEEEETHDDLFSGPSRKDYNHTLLSVWDLEKLEHSSGLLDVIAFLDPVGIPEVYLETVRGELLLSDYPTTLGSYHKARGELLDSSLITKDRSASKITIHRIIQDCVRVKMSNDRSTEVFTAAVDLLWFMWPPAETGVRHHISRWKDCQLLLSQIVRVKEHYLRASKALRSRWIANLKFATLLNELGWYYQERGYTNEALDCYQIAQKNVQYIMSTQEHQSSSFSSITQDDDKAYFLLAEVHNNIAGSATELNDADTALSHFQKYNQMLVQGHHGQTYMADSRLTSSFFNLGMSYTMKGNYEDAILNLEEALIQANKLPTSEMVKSAKSLALINLGLTYWLMKDVGKADDLLKIALNERVELLGPNDRQSMITGRVLHCLGNVKHSQGLLGDSLDFHERALRHFKETVGNTHHRTGNSCFKVAEHYTRIKKLPEAICLLDQSAKIFDSHKCYTPEKGRVMFLWSTVLAQQGQIEKSTSFLQRAHSLYEGICGPFTAEVDLSLENFESFVHAWGR